MSVVSAVEVNCDGGHDALWQRKYTRTYRVVVDDPNDGPAVIRAARDGSGNPYVPIHGTAYYRSAAERDDFIFANNTQASYVQTTADGLAVWNVVVEYGPYDPSTFSATPTDWPTLFWYEKAQYQEAIIKDVSGAPILNSSFERFEDPYMSDVRRRVLMFERNEAVDSYDPDFHDAFEDTLNDDVWNGYAAGIVKCVSIVPGRPQRDTNSGTWYFTVVYAFEINPAGWAFRPVDQGYSVLDGGSPPAPKRLLGSDGQPLAEAVLLNGSGQKLATTGTPVFLSFDVKPQVSFEPLDLLISNCLGK